MADDQGRANDEQALQVLKQQVRAEATEPGRYANNVILVRTQNELFLDFFFVEPPIGPDYTATHIERIVLPTTVMRGFLDALEEQVAGYEKEHGVRLVNQRREDQGEVS